MAHTALLLYEDAVPYVHAEDLNEMRVQIRGRHLFDSGPGLDLLI